MLRLINIERNSNTIRAEYIPEDSEEIGMLEVSNAGDELIKCQTTSYDKPVEVYLRHATKALKTMLNEREIPKTRLVMWY